jgi:gamma-glutamyltranspeptidase
VIRWWPRCERGGGIITREDLAAYVPKWREPVVSTYRGYTLITMPPASSGGITMTESFNILEEFAPLPAFGTAEYTHLLAEAFRRAFIDRNAKLADADFVPVPRDELVSKAYAKTARGADQSHAGLQDAGVHRRAPGARAHDALLGGGRARATRSRPPRRSTAATARRCGCAVAGSS